MHNGDARGRGKPRHCKSLTAPDEHVTFPAASGSITGPVYITVRYEPIDPRVHCRWVSWHNFCGTKSSRSALLTSKALSWRFTNDCITRLSDSPLAHS